jgi:phospholipase C
MVSSFTVSPALAAPGQFVTFSWASANAKSFAVTPDIAQDEQTLPLSTSAYLYNTNGLARTTTFQAISNAAGATSSPMAATLTIVPVSLSASTTAVGGGQSVTLRYSGPNNNSTWELHASYSDIAIPLARTCSGNTCSGSYETGPLAAVSLFSVSLTGPAPTGGQAYSSRVLVSVQQPTTLSFNTQKQSAESGGGVALTWKTTNASSLTISGVGQVQAVGGGSYCCVNPSKSTTYTATAKSIYPGAPAVVATAKVTVSTGDISNLNHIIFLVQENRSFDNYFGQLATYRVNHQPPIQGAQLSDVNDLHTLPTDFQLCGPGDLCYPLFHARTECTDNMSPNWDEAHLDMHLKGTDWLNVNENSTFLMDNFIYSTAPRDEDLTRTRALGYYDERDLPFYYELATQFTTGDAWYSPVATGTLPNRMYLFAGTSYGHAFNPTDPNDPVWQQPTIFRALNNAGVTWRYFYQDNSVFLSQWADWNDPNISGKVRNIQEFYNDLASPNADTLLPQVVFIERATATELDEHPSNNIQTGSAVVANMLSELFSSAAWPDSAFILTYDEGGGLYDHVGPILVTPPDDVTPTDLGPNDIPALFNTTGFRVPMVVVSPWSRPQTVVHLATDYTSILKLIEERFNIPPLTQRDATIPDMADPQNGFFDFSSQHLLQVPPLPTQPTNGVCDIRFSGIKQVKIYH